MSYLHQYPLDCGNHRIIDLDADEHGNYLALLDNGELWTNHGPLPLDRRLPTAHVRRVGGRRFLVVRDAGYPSQGPNAFLFTAAGEQLADFYVGSHVQDVLVHVGRLVVSHYDQAAGAPPPTGDGLGVFDFSGRQLFGYNSRSTGGGWMMQCYAMCPHVADRILFYDWPDFTLLELSLTDFQARQWPAPADFRGSGALTSTRDNVIFWGSYEDNASFYWWNRQSKVTRFGHVTITAPIRGLGNGKFLTYDDHSFTIIDAMQLMQEQARQRRG